MDYGPTIAAAFASQDVKEVRDLRRCVIDIMRNCPQDPMLVQQHRGGGDVRDRYQGGGHYAGSGGGGGDYGHGGGGRGGPHPRPFQYPEEGNGSSSRDPHSRGHGGITGGGESSGRYRMPHSDSEPVMPSGSASVSALNDNDNDNVSVLSGIVSEGVAAGFSDRPAPPPVAESMPNVYQQQQHYQQHQQQHYQHQQQQQPYANYGY